MRFLKTKFKLNDQISFVMEEADIYTPMQQFEFDRNTSVLTPGCISPIQGTVVCCCGSNYFHKSDPRIVIDSRNIIRIN